jgi:cytochrome c oxidase subunit III
MSMEIPYSVTIRPDTGMNNARLGLWLFLASEAMLFGGLFSAYAFLRAGAAPGEFGASFSDVPLAGFNTLVLLASSVVMTLSVWALRAQAIGRHRLLLGLTIILGTIFVAVKWLDYSHKYSLGQYPATSTYLAIFFTLTGIHALHVIGGMIVNSYLWLTGGKLWKTEPDRLVTRVSVAALYWNFVDAVWVILFLLLYVL